MQTWQDIQNCPFQSQKSVKDHLASAQGHLILPPPLANLCSMRSHTGYKNQIFLMPSVGNRHSYEFSSPVPHLQCGLWRTREPALSYQTSKEM